ncbi:glycosyltransferase family 9 protein [Uliginosibacterium gangwonense]|uniref:glycosyltransferase family 9 protein n=1 Tax=Uliginosibacterium gangwonense TaxID=392736 RepID=UPI0003758675|nr:glycosyltransferase family 9 protein [Uliginosibacterium gangwonense]
MASRSAARLWVLARLFHPRAWIRRQPAANQINKVLVLHHLLLGDTLMLSPLLAKLREHWPAAQIILACPSALLPLYAAHPYGVQAVGFNPRERQTLTALAEHGPYDLCLVPAENRFTPLARALGAKWVCGFAGDRPGWKNWLLDEARAFPSQPACFGDFAATLVDGPAPLPYRVEDWPWPSGKPFTPPTSRYAVLHLGASSALKFWPAPRWKALADWLATQGITPVWSAGAKETALVDLADPEHRYPSFAGQLDLLQMAHLLRGACLMVCPDTGVTHLARLAGTPTVALFGPGSPEICGAGEYWRNSPFTALVAPIACRDQHNTFRREEAWIQRCSRSLGTGPGQCPQARCMEALSLAQVQTACEQLL